jgi:hypothetical protein
MLTLVETPETFAPNEGGQAAFMDDWTHRYVALAGGWYAGKTWAGARKLLLLHLWNSADAAGRTTGIASAVIAPTYQLAETINIPELRKALNEAGVKFRFVADKSRYWFELPGLASSNGPSLIYVRTADAPDKITGFTAGALWGDEVARWKYDEHDPLKDPMLQAKGRLRGVSPRFKQFVMTFTHEGDATKVYEDFEREPKADHKLYRAGTFENPDAVEFGEGLMSQLSPTLAAQYLDGLAANFKGGKVYDNFDAAVNNDATLKLDPEKPLQIALDFNNTPGSHAEVGQWFPERQLLTTVHEIYEDGAHARKIAQLIVNWIGKTFTDWPTRMGGWKFPGKLELFGDASGRNPQEANGARAWEEVTEIFRAAGIPYTMRVPSTNPHVADRVAAVNCAFRNAAGAVRYKVHAANCPRLIKDFKTLKWDGNEVDKSDRKISHASDADGYRVNYLLPIRRVQVGDNRAAVL